MSSSKCHHGNCCEVFSWGAASCLPKANVQGHHHHESKYGGPGSQLPIATGLCLGDDIIHDHIDHGSSSEAQGVGEERLCHHHGEGSQDASQGLHHAAQLPIPERFPRGESCTTQRQADSKAFGEVLNANPNS